MHLRKKFDEESIKSKFENSSKTLDDILSSQIPSRDKSRLGYDKENKTECSSLTNQGINKRSYFAALKSPIKREENKKYVLPSHDRDKSNVMTRRPMTSRYQQIFFGHCYSCNNFGHKALNCRAYGKLQDYKKNICSNKPKARNHNFFAPIQRYDMECYKCNKHGHIER